MIINIIGAGPRGLSVALYAIYKGHTVNLIDPYPLHTWSDKHLISNLEMRSPLTFDLVTYLEELKDFSLAKYLGIDLEFSNNQVVIESNNTKVSRVSFYNYLNYIYSHILESSTIYKQKVIEVLGNTIILEDKTTIEGDAVVFCNGFTGDIKKPNWLLDNLSSNKSINVPTILDNINNYKDKNWLVIGTGQGAAEITQCLTTLNGKVTWVVNKVPKVHQYPGPNYSLWGNSSVLGGYYRSLVSYKDRLNYLKRVKLWQPSITPYIKAKLDLVKDFYTEVILTDYIQFNNIEYDYYILANGIKPSINSLPVSSIEIPRNAYLADFPDISKAFKINVPSCNWYISGILATAFDGPRQSSVISAGITAKEIIEDIENGSI